MRRKFIATAGVVAALSFAATHPAAAQSRPQDRDVLGQFAGAVLDALTPDQARRLPIDRRQAWLDQRIDAGLRDGSLTRNEAARLRGEFREIARLETIYRRGGINAREQADLDQRFDLLSRQVYAERRDPQERGWAAINQRQAQLDQRIDAGLRNGSLTPREAERLRDEYRDIARLEARYRRNGLSQWERADLDRRFDALSAQVRAERQDRQAAWAPINARQAELDRRIDAGVRDGSLTAREAERLRAEFREIARLEQRYRRGGLAASERADLDRRFDTLQARIRVERYDRQARRR